MCSHMRSTFAASRSRNSTGNSARPGITLIAPGATLTYPTLPTWLPSSARTTSRTASTSFEAVARASFLRIHGRRARMVGEPCNDAVPAFDTHDPLHHADWHLGLVEVRALFDVQFEISHQSTTWDACVSEVRGILSVTTQPICQCQPLLVLGF